MIDNFLGVSVTAQLKVNTLAELVQAAKAQPGKLNYAATPGLPVYALLALQRHTGIEMANVPYRDFAPAYQDLNQGRLHVIGTGVPTQVAHHRAGTAKLLFVTNRERSPQVPDVPTAKEAGFPDLTFEGVSGVYGWRDMPAEIRQRVVDRRRRDRRRSRFPRPRAQGRHRAAHRHAGGIRRRHRGPARPGRGHPCCDRKAQAVSVVFRPPLA